MSAPRLVALVHGWGGSAAATWEGWDAALIAAGLTPIAVDLPGHGPQGGTDDPSAYADLASDLGQMLPQGLHGAIGFSLGTKLLLELEARSPGANGRLVLGGIGDNIFAPETAGPALVAALRGTATDSPPAVQALIAYATKSRSDPHCLAAVLERPPNPRLDAARLGLARSPILLVNSRDDGVAMPDTALRAALPHAEYHQIDGPGHIGLTDDARFRHAALSFLTRA